MNIAKSQKGELFIITSGIFWSFFPIITILTFNNLPPVFSGSLSILVAALFFAFALTMQKKWADLKKLAAYKDIFLATLFLGIIYYSILFIGIQKTTAGNASIVMLMEIFFAMVILSLWGKEKLTKKSVIGATLMASGALIILLQKTKLNVNIGNLIILFGMIFPPIGNYYMQKARRAVSSTFIMFFRSIISGIALLILALLIEPIPNMEIISKSYIFILINGLLLLGFSKILWIEGIHRIPITRAVSFLPINPALTLIFAYFILKEVPTYWQILGFIPIAIGIMFITDFKLIKKNN